MNHQKRPIFFACLNSELCFLPIQPGPVLGILPSEHQFLTYSCSIVYLFNLSSTTVDLRNVIVILSLENFFFYLVQLPLVFKVYSALFTSHTFGAKSSACDNARTYYVFKCFNIIYFTLGFPPIWISYLIKVLKGSSCKIRYLRNV